jgi:crossover junction endodeoxyribonuclease RuvC
MQRVLGIDVGTAITGWSIIDKDPTSRNGMKLLEYGAILTYPQQTTAERLEIVYNELCILMDKFKPAEMAIESLFYSKNQKTVMTVSQSRGVMLLCAQQKGIQIFEYTPLQVKSGVTGYGKADKKQVQKMVKMILGLDHEPKPDDAADAVAIAITHLNSSTSILKALSKV